MDPRPYFAGHGPRIAAAFALVLAAVFLLRPGIDLAVAALFHDGARFFWRTPLTEALRDIGRLVPALLAAGCALIIVLRVLRPGLRTPLDIRSGLFMLATLAIGPGLIVNGILKAHWGRPRPGQVLEFGGSLPFQPPFIPTDYCPSNCSFVSGEASAAGWVMVLAIVLPRWRHALFWGGLGFALAVGVLRMGFGGHFLSDILFGILVSYTVAALLAPAFLRIAPERFERPFTQAPWRR